MTWTQDDLVEENNVWLISRSMNSPDFDDEAVLTRFPGEQGKQLLNQLTALWNDFKEPLYTFNEEPIPTSGKMSDATTYWAHASEAAMERFSSRHPEVAQPILEKFRLLFEWFMMFG